MRLITPLPELRRLRAQVAAAHARAGGAPVALQARRLAVNVGASVTGIALAALSLVLGMTLRIPVASGIIGFTLALFGVLAAVLGGMTAHRIVLERMLRRLGGPSLSSIGGATPFALPVTPRAPLPRQHDDAEPSR